MEKLNKKLVLFSILALIISGIIIGRLGSFLSYSYQRSNNNLSNLRVINLIKADSSNTFYLTTQNNHIFKWDPQNGSNLLIQLPFQENSLYKIKIFNNEQNNFLYLNNNNGKKIYNLKTNEEFILQENEWLVDINNNDFYILEQKDKQNYKIKKTNLTRSETIISTNYPTVKFKILEKDQTKYAFFIEGKYILRSEEPFKQNKKLFEVESFINEFDAIQIGNEYYLFLFTLDKGIFLSKDFGETWNNIQNGLEDFHVPFIFKNDQEEIFGATPSGKHIFHFNKQTNSWEKVETNKPWDKIENF